MEQHDEIDDVTEALFEAFRQADDWSRAILFLAADAMIRKDMATFYRLGELRLVERGELVPRPDEEAWMRAGRCLPRMERDGLYILAYEAARAGDPVAAAAVEGLLQARLAS